MTAEIRLDALEARNPLGLFAALGALDVATRLLPGRRVTLRWDGGLRPTAVLVGPDSLDHLVELCLVDRDRWMTSPVLAWPDRSRPIEDLKLEPDELRGWIEASLEVYWRSGERADIDLVAGLVADGGVAGKGDSKPTHFHFTAGQQRFLRMARELGRGLSAERILEAVQGPWRYEGDAPDLGWDVRGDRVFALRGFDPSNDKRPGVPGANWLGLLGLRYFPVTVRRGRVDTTGCVGGWKSGRFIWPVWHDGLPSDVVASLLGDRSLERLGSGGRRRLGVVELFASPIRRTSQGGYGSFGAPEPLP